MGLDVQALCPGSWGRNSHSRWEVELNNAPPTPSAPRALKGHHLSTCSQSAPSRVHGVNSHKGQALQVWEPHCSGLQTHVYTSHLCHRCPQLWAPEGCFQAHLSLFLRLHLNTGLSLEVSCSLGCSCPSSRLPHPGAPSAAAWARGALGSQGSDRLTFCSGFHG